MSLNLSPLQHMWQTTTTDLSLRDWFAGQALLGALHDPAFAETAPEKLAEAAYELADAMLKERESTE